MKGYFYHNSIRKYVLLMGNLFSNIYVARGADQYRKVPVTVSSKEQFIASLNSQELNGDGMVANVSTMLPRIALDMVSCTYDSTRKTNVTNRQLNRDLSGDRPTMNKLFNPVPYDFEFEVSVYTRHQDDAFQIIEQILPYFQPQFNTMIRELSENEIVIDERDIPIILESAVPETTFEGGAGEMRHIEWTLNMRLKGWLYPPTNSAFGEIRTIYLNFQDEEQVIIHAEREPVGSDISILWNVRMATETDVAFDWRHQVDLSSDITWDFKSIVERDTEIDWNSKLIVDSDVAFVYDVRIGVDSLIGVDWNTRASSDGELAVDWAHQSSVEHNSSLTWAKQNEVLSTTELNWRFWDFINSTASVEWNHNIVTDSTTELAFNVKEYVGSTLNTVYGHQTKIDSTYQIDFGYMMHTQSMYSFEYEYDTRVTATYNLSY